MIHFSSFNPMKCLSAAPPQAVQFTVFYACSGCYVTLDEHNFGLVDTFTVKQGRYQSVAMML
jgi:hypothetical protein